MAPGWLTTEKRFVLPNGWRLTPAGNPVDLPGDMPGNIIVIDNGKKAIVNTSGFHDHSVSLIDLSSGEVIHSQTLKQSWLGMTVDNAGNILVAGGQVEDSTMTEAVQAFSVIEDKVARTTGFGLPETKAKKRFVSSMIQGKAGLYVLDVQNDLVFLLDNSHHEIARAQVGYRPNGLALSPDGETLAVSNWGDKSVSLLNSSNLKIKGHAQTQSLPCAPTYSPDGRLFVANSGSNTVSVIAGNSIVESIRTGIDPSDRIGSSPCALAISPDGRTLYVANAGNNCVTVVDISKKASSVKGFIPTERYPCALALTPDGKKLLVGTAKGFYGPNAGKNVVLAGNQIRGEDHGVLFRYIGQQLAGRIAIIQVPSQTELANYSQQTLKNAPLGVEAIQKTINTKVILKDALSKIKHVVYVIKENRTYDQVLGDVTKGNGDPNLTIFGKSVTPNEHQLVDKFALFDNFYTDGETSQVGHQWADAAYANDYEEKQWLLSYSRRGEIESDTRLTSSPGEYLWTAARHKGLKARVYGEYVDVQEDHNSLQNPDIKNDPEKFGYSESFERIFARGGRDTEKVEDFIKEMHQAETSGNWPNLMVMALPEDHTHGLSKGAFSPRAMVGNNDRAVGMLVEAISHSKFWKDTAIFVIQDDAQDGPDHVDSHRTVAMVISPYVRRGIVDRTQYSTSSMLRTMELILGIPPMSQYDAKATPMFSAFSTTPNLSPYTLAAPQIDLNEKNPGGTSLARRSAKLDFKEIDHADWNELNRILWAAYKPGIPYPAPVRRY